MHQLHRPVSLTLRNLLFPGLLLRLIKFDKTDVYFLHKLPGPRPWTLHVTFKHLLTIKLLIVFYFFLIRKIDYLFHFR